MVIPNDHYENVYAVPDATLGAVYRTAKRLAMALTSACECEGTSMRQHNEPEAGRMSGTSTSSVFPRRAHYRLYERNTETRMPTGAERVELAEQLRGVLSVPTA